MSATDQGPKQITFLSHHEPGLPAGQYVIAVTHAIGLGAGHPVPEAYATEYRFQVRADRFALSPGDVNGVFPPDRSDGHPATDLPHITFNSKTLPWDRELATLSRSGDKTIRTPVPPQGNDKVKDRVPWLALLLLDEDDLKTCRCQPGKVRDLAPPVDQRVLSNLTDEKAFAKDENAFLDYGESVDDSIVTIDMPATLFTDIAPTLADAARLAHARSVDLSSKAAAPSPGTDDEDDDEPDLPTGDFSVIVGNRLPTPGQTNTVHLVSLEGMARYLPSDDDSPAALPFATVRLISLQSWSFGAIDVAQGAHGAVKRPFKVLLESLNRAGADQPPLSAPPTLTFAPSLNGDATLRGAFAMGYTALLQRLRQGNETVCWYRGPFLPASIPSAKTLPIEKADAALRYDPDGGMFDVSYAAAWQIGRLTCLRDKALAQAVYQWKEHNKKIALADFMAKYKATSLPGTTRADLQKALADVLKNAGKDGSHV